MRILTPAFVAKYEGRMLNIHPSLLPSFKGIHTHQQALDAGVALHGASVHFVIPELDSGAIVAQAAVPVVAGDDADALAARVLAAEHTLYPRAVRWFVEGKLRLDAGRAIVAPDEARWLFADAIDTSTSEGV